MSESEVGVSFGVNGMPTFVNVDRAMGSVDKDIPKQTLKAIEKEAKSLKKEAASLVLEEPTHGDKHTGLREEVSKGVGVQPYEDEFGSGFQITTSMPESNEAIIPRGFDTSFMAKGWRHPLFGNQKGKWYETKGEFSWFMDPMQHAESDLKPKIAEIIDKAAKKIDGAAQA